MKNYTISRFKPMIPAHKQLKVYILDCTATRICQFHLIMLIKIVN
jgi:hypothetical protein